MQPPNSTTTTTTRSSSSQIIQYLILVTWLDFNTNVSIYWLLYFGGENLQPEINLSGITPQLLSSIYTNIRKMFALMQLCKSKCECLGLVRQEWV